LAAKILERCKQRLDGLELVPSTGGCFEVSLDDEDLYSKLKTGEFPDEETMLAAIDQRL